MTKNLLKSFRVKKGMTQAELASLIERSTDSYSKKERGEVFFTPAEIAKISNALGLTFQEMNDIFYDSKLQICNFDGSSQSTITV